MCSVSPIGTGSTSSATNEILQPPPHPYSSAPYDPSIHTADSSTSPSVLCAAILPVCFLIFGLVFLALVHQQQRHLRDILAMKLTKPASPAFDNSASTSTDSPIGVQPIATSGSDSSESVPEFPDINYAFSFSSTSIQAYVGSSTSPLSTNDEDERYCNTPNPISEHNSIFSVNSSTLSSDRSVTSATRYAYTSGQRIIEDCECPGPGRDVAEARSSGTSWSLFASTTTGGAAVGEGENSDISLTSVTTAPPPAGASISMEWDNYLPDDAYSEHFGCPVELNETEHWV